MFVLASYICTLGYLLGHLLSKASLLGLLPLSLGVLLLYFLPLLGLLRVLGFFPPTVLAILWLGYFLSVLASIPLSPIYLASIYLASILLL